MKQKVPSEDEISAIQKALGETDEGSHWCPQSWPCPVCGENEDEGEN